MRNQLIITFFVCSILCLGCEGGEKKDPQSSHAGLDSVLQKQVLLTNDAKFTDERMSARGSAFLMQYDNQLWAVTAKPWIVEDSMVDQHFLKGNLLASIKSWRMYPRVPVGSSNDTLIVTPDSSEYSAYNEDAFFLKAQSNPAFAELKPQFELPAEGDTLFLIGCPRSEPQCKQNVYPMVYQTFLPKTSTLSFLLHDKVDLTGFGGAPIVNRKGEVVAFLTGGGEFLDMQAVNATHIAAIKRVR